MKSPVIDALKAKLSGKKVAPPEQVDHTLKPKPPVLNHFKSESGPTERYLGRSNIIPTGDYPGSIVQQPLVRVDSNGNVMLIGKVKIKFKLGPHASWDLELTPDGKTFYGAEEIRAMHRASTTGSPHRYPGAYDYD